MNGKRKKEVNPTDGKILTIDAGTTGIRSFVYDLNAQVLAREYRELSSIHPQAGWAEQNPKKIWTACLQTMKSVTNSVKGELLGVGITNNRATSILWNKESDDPIYNAITWQDNRTEDLCKRQNAELGFDFFAPSHSSMHVKWMLENVKEAKSLMKKEELCFGTIDSWLVRKLTGGKAHVTDYSNASSTGLYDPSNLEWMSGILDRLDISPTIFPEVRDTASNFGTIEENIIGQEIPIMSVIADQQAALFGEGCFREGDAKCTHGTGSFVDINAGEEFKFPSSGLLPFLAWKIGDKISYMVEGYVSHSGSAIDWLRKIGIVGSSEETSSLASGLEGTDGVYFIPAFGGLSSPYNDPSARGCFFGLTQKTTRNHIVRAVLESVAFRVKDILNAMQEETGSRPSKIRCDGRASSNNFLLQSMANQLGITVERAKNLEASSLGAYYLACLSLKIHDSLEEIPPAEVEKEFTSQISDVDRSNLYGEWKKAVERAKGWTRD